MTRPDHPEPTPFGVELIDILADARWARVATAYGVEVACEAFVLYVAAVVASRATGGPSGAGTMCPRWLSGPRAHRSAVALADVGLLDRDGRLR